MALDMYHAVALATAGGFFPNLLSLWEDSGKAKPDRAPKDILYCLFWIIWPALGALFAYVYLKDGSQLTATLALSIGATGPTTLRAVVAGKAHPTGTPRNAEPH